MPFPPLTLKVAKNCVSGKCASGNQVSQGGGPCTTQISYKKCKIFMNSKWPKSQILFKETNVGLC